MVAVIGARWITGVNSMCCVLAMSDLTVELSHEICHADYRVGCVIDNVSQYSTCEEEEEVSSQLLASVVHYHLSNQHRWLNNTCQ